MSLVDKKAQIERQNASRDRKIRHRKKYEDIQIQGTNNSSIMSKRSVEMIYTSKLEPDMDPWFNIFVKSAKRRSPAVNRGYWIRMESIKCKIFEILSKCEGEKVTIVNLGCGFDPLPFELIQKNQISDKNYNMEFIDIDYPDLAIKKSEIIKLSPQILSLLKNDGLEFSDKYKFCASKKYKLVGCDLNDCNEYKKVVTSLLDQKGLKIFIAEVSLAYMKPEKANPVIEVSSKFENSHFIMLEQILPYGKNHFFAKKMLYHFEHLRSPLNCVQHYSTKEKQVERFKSYYDQVSVKNLFECWKTMIPDSLKRKVDSIEEFDEWEEFIIFCHHYIVLHATNDLRFSLNEEFPTGVILSEDASLHVENIEIKDLEKLNLKHSAIGILNDKIICHGGLDQTRINTTFSVNEDGVVPINQTGDIPVPRMCHSITSLEDGSIILIGGRQRPNSLFNDVYHLVNNHWRRYTSLNIGRARHCASQIDENRILLFGGFDAEKLKPDSNKLSQVSPFSIYNLETKSESVVEVRGNIPNLMSSAMSYNKSKGKGYIIGGYYQKEIPIVNQNIYEFSTENGIIQISAIFSHPCLNRISCKVHFFDDDNLIVIGGVSATTHNTQSETIFKYNIKERKLCSVPFPLQLWKTKSPVLSGFDSILFKNEIYCISGGLVCYSFGSAYNSSFKIAKTNNPCD